MGDVVVCNMYFIRFWTRGGRNLGLTELLSCILNRLAPELSLLILAHTVYKMWIKQKPNTLELWNKLHFEEKETESVYHI